MSQHPSRDLFLAGDIGGTNARLRLYRGSRHTVVDEAVFPSAKAPSLTAIVSAYLDCQKTKVAAAVFGIAGPVIAGVVRTTNLPWTADERRLSRELDIPKVRLINDLAALAVGCTQVGRASKKVIARGRAVAGSNMAVIAAGTGLGEALLIWDGKHYLPSATEGGHADFGPTSDVEAELWQYLRRKTRGGHVSTERLLSGPGLGRMYDFFLERGDDRGPGPGRRSARARSGRVQELAAVARRLASDDRNAAITELGLARKSRAAASAVDLFARIYGAEAGNLVLHGLALGGLFVCGGIASRIIPAKKAVFLAAMRNKGRMTKLLSALPVSLVEDRFVGLTGAGHLAARLAAE